MTALQNNAHKSARKRLSTATCTLHESLHCHPLMERLMQPDLTRDELEGNVAVSLSAITSVENARKKLNVWPALSLAADAAGMRDHLGSRPLPEVCAAAPWTACAPGILGALYVMHGSAFGSAVIAREVRKVIPDAPQSFFLAPRPVAWRFLCDALEALSPLEYQKAEKGALGMFAHYKSLADREFQNRTVTVVQPYSNHRVIGAR